MRCPSCRSPMLTLEIDGVELDYCATELGVWFDEGEIEALFGSSHSILRCNPDYPKSKRRCPRCDTKMRLINPTPDLELDICPYGDGVWFDAGEVANLAKVFKIQSGKQSARFDDIFSRLNLLLGDKS